jgi:hypothetical protein
LGDKQLDEGIGHTWVPTPEVFGNGGRPRTVLASVQEESNWVLISRAGQQLILASKLAASEETAKVK